MPMQAVPAPVQEIPIPVPVPAKHFVETTTAPMDPSTTSLPPPQVSIAAHKPPSSYFKPIYHPKMDEVSREVDAYFLEHWPFKDEKARKKFVDAGFSRVTCLYFPEALDDRIHFACRLLTVLFLIDGTPSSPPIPHPLIILSHKQPRQISSKTCPSKPAPPTTKTSSPSPAATSCPTAASRSNTSPTTSGKACARATGNSPTRSSSPSSRSCAHKRIGQGWGSRNWALTCNTASEMSAKRISPRSPAIPR